MVLDVLVSIFFCGSVTGLAYRHVGGRFQRYWAKINRIRGRIYP